MRVMTGGALPFGHREMNYLAGGNHILVGAVAGETQRASGRTSKVLVKAAVGIMAVGTLSSLKWAMLELLMSHIIMAFTVQAGELILNIGVIPFVVGVYSVAEAAFATQGQILMEVIRPEIWRGGAAAGWAEYGDWRSCAIIGNYGCRARHQS